MRGSFGAPAAAMRRSDFASQFLDVPFVASAGFGTLTSIPQSNRMNPTQIPSRILLFMFSTPPVKRPQWEWLCAKAMRSELTKQKCAC